MNAKLSRESLHSFSHNTIDQNPAAALQYHYGTSSVDCIQTGIWKKCYNSLLDITWARVIFFGMPMLVCS